MKKLIVLLCAVILTSIMVVNAQTGKGKIMLGTTTYALGTPLGSSSGLMNIGFGKTTYKSNYGDYTVSQTSFNLQPKAGYFFTGGLAGGLALLYSSASSKEEDEDGKAVESLVVFGPFVRYYFPVGSSFAFAELEGGFGQFRDKWTGEYDYDDKYGVTAFGFGAGIMIPVGTKAGFDFSLGYESFSAKQKEDNPDDEKMVTGTFGIKAGFMLYLGGE